jgi:tetratricopeptide (TPR) repeat protein
VSYCAREWEVCNVGPGTSAATAAAEAIALVKTDPKRARALAEQALDLARHESDDPAASIAERALGLAARGEHDLDGSLAHLRRAVRIAEHHGLAELAAEARISLGGTLALNGGHAAALRQLERAMPALSGLALAKLQMQRATILMMQDRYDEALEGWRRALPELRRAGDLTSQATLLGNRGLVHSYQGDMAAAERDLVEAERLHTALGEERAAADIRQNLGFIAARRGDVPTALTWFDRADAWFRTQGFVDAIGLRDRCEALLAARLVDEARELAEEAVRELERVHIATALAEARLMLAEAALLDGDPATAREAAQQARRGFVRQRRTPYALLARYAELRAARLGGGHTPAMLAAAKRTADALDETGWAVEALDARLMAGSLALELGRPGVARRELGRAARVRGGPVAQRSRAWHARALLRLTDGDRRGAEAAVRAGLHALDVHRAALGASDLRAHASGHAAELARLGVRLTLQDADPRRMLAWAERWRAGALHLRPMRPPEDIQLAADLTALRAVMVEIDRAALEGRNTAALLRRQQALETSVRSRARHATGLGLAPAGAPADVHELARALGERALLEYVQLDGELHAVTLVAGQCRLHRLGPPDEVSLELEYIRFALRRLTTGPGSAASHATALRALDHAGRRLDELLMTSLRDQIGDRPLVVIPTGTLHAVPWATLPGCARRPVTVAPSATIWCRLASAPRVARPRRVVLVAGPGLPDALREVEQLRAEYPDAECLTGADATVAAVTAALQRADLAHLAAHGRFRADNPLLSSLALTDGPLTVYDLEALARVPDGLVLSACDAGLSEIRAGDELMGLAAALFSLGARTLVAAVATIPDGETRPIALALHQSLRAGQSPARALAHTVTRPALTDAALATAKSFVCFGAG